MQNTGPRFVLEVQGQKRTFGTPIDLTNKKIHKTTLRVRYKDSQGNSQEVELEEVMSQYNKPELGQREEFKIITSDYPNTDWANPSMLLWRTKDESTKKQPHFSKHILAFSPWQVALRQEYFKSQNKPVGTMTGEDWTHMISWIRAGAPSRVKKPEGTKTYKSGSKKGQVRVTPAVSVVLHHPDPDKVYPCYLYYNDDQRSCHHPICGVPDCLSHKGVTYSGKRCYAHYGATSYAAVKVTHTNGGIQNIPSICTKFDYEESADEERKEERLISTIKLRLNGGAHGGWNEYTSILKARKENVDYKIEKVIFSNWEDTEKYLALHDTARLIAYLARGKSKGHTFNIINLSLALSFKNEEFMESHLWREYNTRIKCVQPQLTPFPTGLGRQPCPGSTSAADEVTIYAQGNQEVVYTGKQDSESANIASKKSQSLNFQNYVQTQGKMLHQYPIMYCKNDRGDEVEQLVNFSNYIGHLFQLRNRFTGTNFLCLNKEVRVKYLDGKWDEIQTICRWLYGMEITLSIN